MRRDRDVQRDERRRDGRAGDGAGGERGVEARHDRPADPALDLGALDVHRDVPHRHGEADHEQAGDQDEAACRRTRQVGEAGDDQPAAGHDRRGGDGAALAEPGQDRAGERPRHERTGGGAEQHPAEPCRAQVQVVPQLRDPGDPARQQQSAGGEHDVRGADGGVQRHGGARSLAWQRPGGS
ncbi:hypothetical protein OHA72_39760 [Dactylosporangium sp. NBC_01737]|nr:hypothetical protein OHA72_39760 [Dactylosporangium sp. NBC_01737]